jgi:glycerophosphoryl diester phosphodiesterase
MQNFQLKPALLLICVIMIQCDSSMNQGVSNEEMLLVSFSTSAEETAINKPISFVGTTNNVESGIVSWQWDFADGAPLVFSKSTSYTFNFAGSYLVKLTVKSKSGKTAEYSKRILVKNDRLPEYGNLISIKEKLSMLYPKVMVAAHRGYTLDYPENSVESLLDAAVHDVNLTEIDVRLTLDNELVAMHDANTGRTTNQNVAVSEKTLKELKQLKLMHKGIVTNIAIPTLKEYLEAAKGKIYVAIDGSKLNTPFFFNKIYNTVAALNMIDMVLIYTTSAQSAESLLKIDKNVNILLGAGNATDYSNAVNLRPGAVVWHLSSTTLSPLYTNEPTKAGIKLWANAYVNSADVPPSVGRDPVISNLIDNQVSIIQTDYPLEIINYLKNQSLWLK